MGRKHCMKCNKKLKNLSILALLSFACGLASCNEKTSSTQENDSNSEAVVSSSEVVSSSKEESSSVDGHFDSWSKEQQEIIKKYCGSILPYPTNYFSGEITVREYYDEQYDYYYLEIFDQAKGYSIEDYYKTLEDFGWSPIKTFNGKTSQTDTSGISFVELTKCSSDEKVGYDMTYYYNSAISTDGGEVVSGNYIRCYNNLSGKKTTDTSWSEDALKTIKDVTTTTLPYIQLGESNGVSQLGDNTLAIFDYYAKDLSSEIYATFIDNGYSLDRISSINHDAFILNKTLEDGATISVMFYYYGGNNIQVYYTPEVISSTSWPENIINEVKTKTGVDVPSFEIDDNGSYLYYKKNDSYYIYTINLKDGFNYETYALNTLKDQAITWEETISFNTYYINDENGDTYGFGIEINALSPKSTFVDSYPDEVIETTIADVLKVSDFNLPEFDETSIPSSDKKVKYSVRGEEYYQERYAYYYSFIKQYPWVYGLDDNPSDEYVSSTADVLASSETGIIVSIFDKEEQARNSYEKTLTNACWYKYIDDDNNVVYEDPTGKIAITISSNPDPSRDNYGETTFFIHPGAGEIREPEFYFQDENVDVAIGASKQLFLTVNMLPYEVTYESSDETGGITVDQNGEVTIKDSVEEGTTATITASINVPGESEPRTATCTVTAANIIYYTPETAIAKIGAKLSDQGYSPVIIHRDRSEDGELGFDFVRVDLGDMSVSDVETLVEENLIPNGFEEGNGWEKGTAVINNENDYTVEEKDVTMCTYSIFNEACYIILEYDIYIENGHTFLYVSAF